MPEGKEYYRIGVGQGNLAEPLHMVVDEIFSTDPRFHVPSHMLKDIYIAIPMDIQIRLTNGQTVMIQKKAEGTLSATGEMINGYPSLVGKINIRDK